MPAPQIRAKALCLFRREDRILVNQAHDAVKGEDYCRPLGGGIEFGETSAEAVVREIREELDAEAINLRLVGTLENIFTYNGSPGHEIVMIYDGEFADAKLYDQPFLTGVESNGEGFQAQWRALDAFSERLPLYPTGLAHMLSGGRGPAVSPLLESRRLLIRPYVPEDAEALHDGVQASLDTVGRWLPWCHAGYSLADAQAWISQCRRAQEQGSAYDLGLFLRDSGQLCGSVAINQINRAEGRGNIGYWLRQDMQGMGLASEAVQAIVPFGFNQLGLTRLEIIVAADNRASRRVAERVGARTECLARNRLLLGGAPTDAWIHVLTP